jgi:ferritin-like metal-binding protein YciE
MKDLEKLFINQLREVYDCEHQLAGALAEMELYAKSKMLKLALAFHCRQTENHFKRLEKAFAHLKQDAQPVACKGIEGIIDEAQVLVEEYMENSALDAALIAAGQKAEHYEISAYRALCNWAEKLNYPEVVELLKDNLSEEEETDAALKLLAKTTINPEALRHDSPKRTDEEAEFLKAITHGP